MEINIQAESLLAVLRETVVATAEETKKQMRQGAVAAVTGSPWPSAPADNTLYESSPISE